MTAYDVIDLIVYPELADSGDPVGLYVAGMRAVELGRLEIAFTCFERAAEHGNGKAACELGILNRDGNTLKKRKNSRKAIFWFKRSIELRYYPAYEELYKVFESKGESCRQEMFDCLIGAYKHFLFFHPEEFLYQIREYYLLEDRQLPWYFYYIKHIGIEVMPECMMYYEIAKAYMNDSLDGLLTDRKVAFRLLQHAQKEFYKEFDKQSDNELLVNSPNYCISRASFFRVLGNALSYCVSRHIGTKGGNLQQCIANFNYITISLAIQIIKLWQTDFGAIQEAIGQNRKRRKFSHIQGIIEKGRRIAWCLRELKLIAHDGNYVASNFLLRLYRHDVLVHASSNMLLDALTWSAENGDTERQLELANCYRFGKYTVKDAEQAKKWYRRAAVGWYPRATAELFGTFLQEAESGDIISSVYLGYDYENGFGVKADAQQALYWYEMAGVEDCAPAMIRSAHILYLLHKGTTSLPGKLRFRGRYFSSGDSSCIEEAKRLCDLVCRKFGDAGDRYVSACREMWYESDKKDSSDLRDIFKSLLSDKRFFDVNDYINRIENKDQFWIDSYPKNDRSYNDNPLNLSQWEQKEKEQNKLAVPHKTDFTWIDRPYGTFFTDEEFHNVKKHKTPPRDCLNNAVIYVCAANRSPDMKPEKFTDLYPRSSIFHEADYVICGRPDGSIRGNVRYIIISNHMKKLQSTRSGFSNAYVSTPDSYFMVWHTFVRDDIAIVVLLHLPNEDWRDYRQLVIDNESDFLNNLKEGLFFYDDMAPDELLSSDIYLKHTSRNLLGFRGTI